MADDAVRFTGSPGEINIALGVFLRDVRPGSFFALQVEHPVKWSVICAYTLLAGDEAHADHVFTIGGGEFISGGFWKLMDDLGGCRFELPVRQWPASTFSLTPIELPLLGAQHFARRFGYVPPWEVLHPAMYESLIDDLRSTRDINEQLRARLDAHDDQFAAARARSAERSSATNAELADQLMKVESQYINLQAHYEQCQATLKATQARLQAASNEVHLLRQTVNASRASDDARASLITAELHAELERTLAKLSEAADRGVAQCAALDAAKRELHDSEATNRSLRAELALMHLRAEALSKDHGRAVAERDEIKNRLERMTAELEASRNSSPAPRHRSRTADADAILQHDTEREQARIRAVRERDDALLALDAEKRNTTRAEKRQRDAQDELKEVQRRHAAKEKELLARVEAAERAVDDFKTRLTDADRIASLNESDAVANLRSELRKQREEFDALERRAADAKRRADTAHRDELERAQREHEQLVRTSAADLDRCRDDITRLEARLATQTALTEDSEKRVATLRVECDAAIAAARTAESRLRKDAAPTTGTNTEALLTAERRIVELTVKARGLEDELHKARRDAPSAAAVRDLETEMRAKDETIRTLTDKVEALKAGLASRDTPGAPASHDRRGGGGGHQSDECDDARSSNGASDSTGSDVGYLPLILTASALRPALAPGSVLNDAQRQSYQQLLHRIHTGTLTTADHELILKAPPRQLAEAEQDEADTRSPWQLYMWPLLCSGLDTPEERIACIRAAMSSTSTWITAASQNCTQDISALITAYCHTFTAADDSNARAIYKVYERRLFDLIARFSGIDSNREAERIAGITTTKRPADPATRLIAYGLSHAAGTARGGKGGGGKHKPKHGAT